MTPRCSRCGHERICSMFDSTALCEGCLRQIVLEWNVKREEFGKLTES